MMNGNLTISDLTNLSDQQQARMMDNSAATLRFDYNDDETQSTVHDSEPSSLGQKNDDLSEGQQASPEEMPSKEFEKELFLEEIRMYRCLWDTNSEGYKNRPMKQNAWSKLSQLFNKDGEYQNINFAFGLLALEFLKPFLSLLQIGSDQTLYSELNQHMFQKLLCFVVCFVDNTSP
eukprot:Seg1763.3 transcript_id=Seg1763.3/GoldUCD/mRNA.D3Y31 product="hypothetical protein" protein_id=Seg1763.3/GoldUCD/D3Y31